MYFQTLSRNNDVSGNPYRLTLLYNEQGGIHRAIQSRSSMPNIVHELKREGHIELIGLHLSPSEYKATKNSVKHYGVTLEESN